MKPEAEYTALQKVLLRTYGHIHVSAWIHRSWVQRPFFLLYSLYKRYFEDPFPRFIRQFPDLFRGGSILDVGANIGYTAILFNTVLEPGRKIYAFEPEEQNLQFFRNAVHWSHLENQIAIIPMAVGEHSGPMEFWINPDSHADHRILTEAFRSREEAGVVRKIQSTSIDDFLAQCPEASSISFIKIDVQGYEESVCRGMERTLGRHPNVVVAAEYFPKGISDLGFDPYAMIDFFEQRGYRVHALSRRTGLTCIDPGTLRGPLPSPGYIDLVFARRPLVEKGNK